MATATEVDVAQLVESAFDECRCESDRTEVKHKGKIAGLWVGHTCAQQLICEAHFKFAVDVTLPRRRRKIEIRGSIQCAVCLQTFYALDDFVKVIPV